MEEIKKILGSVTVPPEIVKDVKESVKNISEFTKKIEVYLGKDITSSLDIILYGAISLDASDVHIEPQKNNARLRIRLDGALQDVTFLENTIYRQFLSRIKLLSKLKLNITGKPQDGRFTIVIEQLPIEIRTSTLPAEYGEAVVMRILNPQSLLSLEKLGLRKDVYEVFKKEIQRPHGMIMVTGPTGSGKTTTLYAFLLELQNSRTKIITIEDPIEYHVEGIEQTQVAPEKGYSFAEGLRSIVRQDPDVIMVGEIRDAETARIALQASLTGHLVFSTIHTNDAAGTIPRLIDLKASSATIASALKMVIGERLVRKVCKKCSVIEKPSPQELSEIKQGLKNIPKSVDIPHNLNEVKIPKVNEKGCDDCNFSGYKGRKGIFETFLEDQEMQKFILQNPSVSEIKEKAMQKGMVTMYQSGLIEVVLGETTLEEVHKVVEVD